ncbi:MAG: hypothetical protein HFI89_03145 [Lachnospiraceae bacterium]|nr:hypothetical protein [Lachnospiraceae bacterium]
MAFIRRYLMHVLYSRSQKIRYSDFLNNRGKRALFALRMMLSLKIVTQVPIDCNMDNFTSDNFPGLTRLKAD